MYFSVMVSIPLPLFILFLFYLRRYNRIVEVHDTICLIVKIRQIFYFIFKSNNVRLSLCICIHDSKLHERSISLLQPHQAGANLVFDSFIVLHAICITLE